MPAGQVILRKLEGLMYEAFRCDEGSLRWGEETFKLQGQGAD